MLKGLQVKGEIDRVFAHGGQTELKLPVVGSLVYAGGFASLAEDWIADEIDFNDQFIKHPTTTFYARIVSDSMEPEIHDGSIVVYDTALEWGHGSRVVAVVNGCYVAKVLWQTAEGFQLRSYNPKYPPIKITEGMECDIKGKITVVIRTF
jgi:DNA polymerase V